MSASVLWRHPVSGSVDEKIAAGYIARLESTFKSRLSGVSAIIVRLLAFISSYMPPPKSRRSFLVPLGPADFIANNLSKLVACTLLLPTLFSLMFIYIEPRVIIFISTLQLCCQDISCTAARSDKTAVTSNSQLQTANCQLGCMPPTPPAHNSFRCSTIASHSRRKIGGIY